MAGGYFLDGAVSVEIGEHAFLTPSPDRRNVVLVPHDRAATLLDSGGGTVRLEVTGQRLRANLGDAERYAVELFVALAGSGPGNIGVEDQLGNRAAFAQAVCTGASAEVQAWRFVDMRFDFQMPEKAAEPAWAAIQAAPAIYAGTSTLVNYAAGGIALGTHPAGMRIEMTRDYPLREIPRARGARSRGPGRGALLRLTVTSHAVASGENLARYLEDLARQIGPRHVDLTANGNTFADVLLESLRPAHTDRRATEFDAELVKQL